VVTAGSDALGGAGTVWAGAAPLRGGKGYAPCPLGQLHYRQMGDGASPPILLIHQTPVGMAEYIDIQPALAASGRRSVVSDNPGYGMSDPADGPLTVAALADNLIGLIDHLNIEQVIVAGRHTGAAFAAAFAARNPDRTAGVVLHGSPNYCAQERAERLSRPSEAPTLKPDGSHLADTFKNIYAALGPEPDDLAAVNWATIGQYLSTPKSPVYKAVFSNDMSLDIAAIRAPTLILSDRNDILHDNDKRLAAQRPDFTYLEFSQERAFSMMRHPQRWAETVLLFADDHNI
jgi:pimeloyl-ACP methyl ester carboxylesterase